MMILNGEREGNMDKIVIDFGNIIEEMKNKTDQIMSYL